MAINDNLFIEEFLKLSQEDFDLMRDTLNNPPAPNEQMMELFTTYPTPPEPCKNCSALPENGGSGICHCTLGNNTTVC